jgi:hypothetical protein
MNKRTAIAAILATVLALGGGVWLIGRNTRTTEVPVPSESTPVPTVAPVTAKWNDPAGFAFVYPAGVTVNKHDEDTQNYAHVEMTAADHPGNLIVWAVDTSAADAAGWVAADKRLKGAPAIDSTLGGLAAKKVVLSGSGTQLVGTVTDSIAFYVEASQDGKFWSDAFDTVKASFAFTDTPAPAQPRAAADTSGGDEGAMDEEIVE